MKSSLKFDTVGFLVVISFSLLGIAFFSLWWTGHVRSYRQTVSQYLDIPRYYKNLTKHERNRAVIKAKLKQKCREIFTGSLLAGYIREIDRRPLSPSAVNEIFPGLAKAAVGKSGIVRKGRDRISERIVLKTEYLYGKDIFHPLSGMVADFKVKNFTQEQVDAFLEPEQLRLYTKEHRVFHLLLMKRRWFIERIEVIPLETRLRVSRSDQVNTNLFIDLKNPKWLDLNHQLAYFYHQKQLSEANAAANEAFKTARKIFGADHLGTGIAINNLALVCMSQDRLDEASLLFRQTGYVLTGFLNTGKRRELTLTDLGLLNESSDYKAWIWPVADFRIAGIEPGMSEDEARKILGEPSRIDVSTVSRAWKANTAYKELSYPQVVLSLCGTGTELRVRQITVTGREPATFRGVKLGDPRLTALWVYGPPENGTDDLLEYRMADVAEGKPRGRYLNFRLDLKGSITGIETGVF